MNNRPMEMSGGQQQRVAVARALASKPQFVLADEPTGNLDHALARDVMNLFQRFQEVGVTVVIATHDLALVQELGHREVHIDDGRVIV